MKPKRLAVLFPHSLTEKNSAISRLEMFRFLDFENDLYHFGDQRKDPVPLNQAGSPYNQFSIGRYYPLGSPLNLLSAVKLVWTLGHAHRRKPYDAIWATLPPIMMALFGTLASRIFQLPLIVDVRDPGIASASMAVSKGSLTYKLAHRLEGYIYRHAKKICVVTPELKQLLNQEFHADLNKIELVSNATVEKYPNSAKLPAKKITVFYAGAFAAYQVMDWVIENLIEHKDEAKDYHFEFYGYDQTRQPELQTQIEQAQIDSWVKLLPSIPRAEVFAKMDLAHVVLVPISGRDKPELFDYAIPLKLYEALSYSKPILLFEGTAASRHAVAQHQLGVVCSRHESIFTALNAIKTKYQQFSESCFQTVYSRETEARKLAKFISEL